MTSTTDTTQHPDVSEISDLTEGLLPPSRTAQVSHHVDGCELCSDVRAALEEIRGLLGELPGAMRMPDDIADRIDAALAAEAFHDASAPGGAADVSRETETDGEQEQPAGDLDVGTQETHSKPASRPAGHGRAATGPSHRSTRRRRTIALGTVLGAALVGVSVLMLQAIQTSQNSSAAKAADAGVSAAEKDPSTFSGSPLSGRVQTLLSPAGAPSTKSSGDDKRAPSVGMDSTPESAPPASASPTTPLEAPVVSVPACVQQGTGRKTAALAIEKGTYEDTDAFLVVLPHGTDAALVQAYVVDASCVHADPAGKGRLLLTRTYSRP